jgi:ABC-type transporter Mla subunit MlaD
MSETQATILIVIIGVGVLVHVATMIALYLAAKDSSARVKALAEKIETRALPALEAARSLIVDTRPKIEGIIDNLAATTTTLRGQMERLDATVNDIVDRTRLQVIRADELVSRTIDKVEETTELVQHTVVSPVRHLAGLLQGLTAGFGTFFSRGRRPRHEAGVPQDELFI